MQEGGLQGEDHQGVGGLKTRAKKTRRDERVLRYQLGEVGVQEWQYEYRRGVGLHQGVPPGPPQAHAHDDDGGSANAADTVQGHSHRLLERCKLKLQLDGIVNAAAELLLAAAGDVAAAAAVEAAGAAVSLTAAATISAVVAAAAAVEEDVMLAVSALPVVEFAASAGYQGQRSYGRGAAPEPL